MATMKVLLKKAVADRLLALREKAGDDIEKNRRYHILVTRYQKFLLRRYLTIHCELRN